MGNRKLPHILNICLLAMPIVASANIEITTPSSETQWYDAKGTIAFKVAPDNQTILNKYSIFLNRTDVTALFDEINPGEFRRINNNIPLPAGEQELIVYIIKSNQQWLEIGRTTLNVRTVIGLEQVETSSRLTITNKSQWDEEHSGDASPPERHEYHDVTTEGGFNINATRGKFAMNIDANIIGASHRPEALRYEQRGEDAPKLDLADYLAEFQYGDAKLAMGHINSGSNPLLLSDFATRGLKANMQINPVFDLTVSAQNGTEIVGYNRIFGIKENEHQVNSATIGAELNPSSPGSLRAEISYLDASIQAEPGFDTGEVPEAEKSDGYGLRITSNIYDGRIRTDLSYARSNYTNPSDPFLDFEEDIIEVEETTNSAHRVDFAADLINVTLSNEKMVTLTAQYVREHIDPEYKTLGAFPNSDQLTDTYLLNGTLGSLSLSLSHDINEDNLDNIATVLKTRTRTTTTAIEIPLQDLINTHSPTQYWPSLSLSHEYTHQKAANKPIEDLSGFNSASHLPDQITDNKTISLSWSLEKFDFSYAHSRSFQDNRQNGRELADFTTITKEANIAIRPLDTFDVSLTIGNAENRDRENNITQHNDTYDASVNWRLTPQFSLVTSLAP